MQKLNLGCDIQVVRADFRGRGMCFEVPAGECVDMLECVMFSMDAMPDIRFIGTYSGDDPDTGYYRMEGEEHADACEIGGASWLAVDPDQWQ